MNTINKYTLTVRRESFIKAIRNEQRQQFKAQKRAKMLQSLHFRDQLWRFKMSLHTLDLSFQQERAIKFVEQAQQHSHSEQFCHYLKSSLIVEQLIELMANSQQKGLADISVLVQKVFDLIYGLVARSNIFLPIVEKQFNLLILFLYKYPTKNNLDKISQFFTCIDQLFKNTRWLQLYGKTKIIAEEQVIVKLMNIYIYENSYYVGEAEITKRSNKWFKNAIKCLEITYSLIRLQTQGSVIWQNHLINQSLYEGLSVFINQQDFTIQNFEQETCEIEAMSETKSKLFDGFQSEQSNLYFISLILDILLMKQKLLQEREIFILKGILQILLKQLNKYSIINLTAIKIIKILYEQIIFDEDQLIFLANSYPHLTVLIHRIIENDFV